MRSIVRFILLLTGVNFAFCGELYPATQPTQPDPEVRFGKNSLPDGLDYGILSPTGEKVICNARKSQPGRGIEVFTEVRETSTGRLLLRVDRPNDDYALCYAFGDERFVAISYNSGEVDIWDLVKTKTVFTSQIKSDNNVRCLALTVGGKYLLAGGKSEFRIWDVASGKKLHQIQYPKAVTQVIAIPETQAFVIGDGAGAIFMIDAVTGKVTNRTEVFPERKGPGYFDYTLNSVFRIACSPDARRIACQSFDFEFIHFSADPKKDLLRTKIKSDYAYDFHFSPDGATLLTFGNDGVVRRWDPTTGEDKGVLIPRIEAANGFGAMVYSADGKKIHTLTKLLRTWDAETGRELTTSDGHKDRLTAMAACPQGKWVATGSVDGTVQLWNPKTGERLATLDDGVPVIRGLTTFGDGRRLIAAGSDGIVRIWEDGKVIARIEAHPNQITDLAASADGRVLMTAGSDFTVRIWNLANQKLVRIIPTDRLPRKVVISDDGVRAATLHERGDVLLWDVASGKSEVIPYEGKLRPQGISLSPSGHLLVTTGSSIRLVDTATRLVLYELEPEDFRWAPRIAFLNNRTLVATSLEKAGVIDLLLGNSQLYQIFPANVSSMAVVPGQLKLYTGHWDPVGFGWDLTNVVNSLKHNAATVPLVVTSTTWKSLLSQDPQEVRIAINLLIHHKDSAAYFKSSIKPIASVADADVAINLKQLDADDFDTRDRAFKQLLNHGDAILPQLHKRLVDSPGADLKGKIEELIAKAEETTPERLGLIRVVLILEYLDTPASRDLLAEYAKGAETARLTIAAKAALQRLKKSP